MADRDTAVDAVSLVRESLSRPYPVSILMFVLLLIVPLYIVIAESIPGRALHVPALALDRVVPLQPVWALVYGSLYLFVILLPLFVVRQPELIRRTLLAYLTVWTTALVCFLLYPTVAPRPASVIGDGFIAWGLRFLYSADPPYNCFPSLHVAHSFVSALACWRVHRGVGIGATTCASLIALSTLFTRQHYVLDVFAGILLALIACALFLRDEEIPELDRRVAPVFAAGLLGMIGLTVGCLWAVYAVTHPRISIG